MNTITVSATKARNEFFDLLNLIALGNTEVLVERDRKPIAVIFPKRKAFDWKKLKKASDACHGIMKDFSQGDSVLRRPGANNFLGKWDTNLK